MAETATARRGRPPSHTSERRGLKSTDTGSRILCALAADGPLGLTELAFAGSVGVSTAHRHLAGFIEAGLVRQAGSGGHYDLGPVSLQIGLAALSRLDVVALAEPKLRDLADGTGFTALLSVWSDRGPTIVRWQRAPLPFVTSLGLGSVLPATRSATGLAFLAFLPRAVTAEVVARERGREVDARQLADFRSTRLATVDGTVIPGLSAIASPALDLQGEAAAVVTLIGADKAFADGDASANRRLLQATSGLSAALGYRSKDE
ncbi:MAG: IclR family transcriptional regulator [Pseudomonadota bacterium]